VNDSLDFGSDAASVEVLDASGRRVHAGGSSWDGRIGGRPAPGGLYVARVSGRDGSVRHQKILVVR
jgi:hypothetical protein